jgi:tRNA(Ile)-lysidine synthase
MDLSAQFREYIFRKSLFHPKDKLLLAVSGGVDSVVLCHLCRQSGFDFSIAHCNFKLRGAESERDQQFVKDLAEKSAVDFYVKEFETEKYAADNKVSVQVAARELRYAWFDELVQADENPVAAYILTAHHQDDNIETLLMNFFKGTGIAGLRGILPKNKQLIRPLLFAKKEALLSYAKENKLDWIEDSSNESDKYSRNYFRHQIIPLVQNIFPEAVSNLGDNINRFAEVEQLYRESIDLHKKKLLEQKGNEIHIPVLKLKKTAALQTVIYEIIKDYGFSAHQASEVIQLLDSETGRHVQSKSHQIIKNRNWLIIAENPSVDSSTFIIEREDKLIEFKNGLLEMKISSADGFKMVNDSLLASVDVDKIKFPLILRQWKPGDYFYPLGMPKKKKISRFLIDQKLSKTDKEAVWVLETDKKIVWVVGMRIDDRFKLTASTKQVLHVSVKVL